MATTELAPRINRVEDLAHIPGPGPVILAGREEHVRALLQHVVDTGRVAAMTPPKQSNGGIALAVRLRPLPGYLESTQGAVPVHWTQRLSRRATAVMVAVGAIVVGAAAALAYLAVAWLIAHLVAVLVVAALLGAVGAVAGPRTCKTVITVIHRH